MSQQPPAFILLQQPHLSGQFPACCEVPQGGKGEAPAQTPAICQQPLPNSVNGEASFNEYGASRSYIRMLGRVTYLAEPPALNTGNTLADLPQSVLLNIFDHFENPGSRDISRLARVNKHFNLTFTPMLNQYGLRHAARRSNIQLLKQCLKAGANPSWPLWSDTNSMVFQKPALGAALQEAAQRGNIKVLEALLNAGADINSRDCCGDTALHRAVSGGHLNAVILLVTREARIDILDLHDFTPFDVAIEKVRVKVTYCFLRMGYDANRLLEPCGSSALHRAVDGNSEQLVTALLMFGADINATDWCGATPLIRAVRKRKSLGVIKVLLEQLPNLYIRDRSQRNVLWYAVANKNRELTDLFSRYYAGQELNRLIKEAKEEVERWDRCRFILDAPRGVSSFGG